MADSGEMRVRGILEQPECCRPCRLTPPCAPPHPLPLLPAGVPALGVQWQRMESAALRAAFCMSDEQKGVLVRSVQPISHAHGLLVPGDVLLAFDGVEVASGEFGRYSRCRRARG